MPVESGRALSHYRLVEKIGEGGMGVVWKAEDTVLNRTVAIKVLPADLALDEERRRMFLDEARLAASVGHAHIVQVYELAREGDLDFIVMEYVEGHPLGRLLQGKPLPPDKVAQWGAQVARGLARAHHKGLVHRDLKPGNILVTPEGDVKIVDFGLATLFSHFDTDTDATASMLTAAPGARSTGVAGTLPYMSPEQVRGEKLDARSDIFSLGTVLYEMTTGKRPFTGRTPADVAQDILRSQPTPVHQLLPNVPLDLDRIIVKALAPRPADRYQHIDDMVVDLKRLDKELESGSAPSRGDPRQVAHPKRPWLRSLLVIASLVAACFIAWIAWIRLGERRFRAPASPTYSSAAVLPLKSVDDSPGESEYLADGITEAIITKLTQLPNLRVIPWMTAQQYKNTKRPLQEIAEEMRVDAVITGSLRRSDDRIAVTISLVDSKTGLQFWGDEFEERLSDIFAVQRRIAVGSAEKLGGKLTPGQEGGLSEPASRSAEAYELFLRGKAARKQAGMAANDLALELFQRALALDVDLAEAHAGIGDVLWLRYYMGWQADVQTLESARESYERALALDPSLPDALGGLINVNATRGRSEECLRIARKAASFGLEDAGTLRARAEGYYGAALWDKAVALYLRALELDPANQDYTHGIGYLWLGRYREAAEVFEANMRRFGERARLHVYIGMTYHCLGDTGTARFHYAKAIELEPDDFVVYRSLGVLCAQSGKRDEAREAWRRGAEILRRMLEGYPRNLRLRTWLAQFYALLGEREQVLRQEAAVLAEEPGNGALLANLAYAHAYLGNTHRAVMLLQQALSAGSTDYYALVTPMTFGLQPLLDSAPYAAFQEQLSERLTRLRQQY